MDETLESTTSTTTAPSFGNNISSNTGSQNVAAVGTNLTVNITGDTDSVNQILTTLNSRTEPFLVGSNTTVQIDTTGGSGQSSGAASTSGPEPRTDSNPDYQFNFIGGAGSTTGGSQASRTDSNPDYTYNFAGGGAATTEGSAPSTDSEGPIVGTNQSITDSGIPPASSGNAPGSSFGGGGGFGGGGFGSGSAPAEGTDSVTGTASGGPVAGGAGGGSPFPGGNNPFNAPQNNESYQWNFAQSSDPNSLFQASPWGRLSDVGVTSFQQIFGDDPTLESNPFGGGAAGGGPGGGGNPIYGTAGGGNPFSGSASGSSNPMGGETTATTPSAYSWNI